jgi:NTE family protein
MVEQAMNSGLRWWMRRAARYLRRPRRDETPVRIGIALGGGFARGIAHLGVLRAFEANHVPLAAIAGVSAGSIVAAAYASGSTLAEIEQVARSMRFKDVARWTISRFGLAETDRMVAFLKRALKSCRFEDMRIPLAVVASDLTTGQPAVFRDTGDVCAAVRASCAYPGLFLPVRHEGRLLVDGLISMQVPAAPLRSMGVTHVVSVALRPEQITNPRSVLCVVNRCFQIYAERTQAEWRRESALVIEPEVSDISWDSFASCGRLIEAGERAALEAMPRILEWLGPTRSEPAPSGERQGIISSDICVVER